MKKRESATGNEFETDLTNSRGEDPERSLKFAFSANTFIIFRNNCINKPLCLVINRRLL